MQDITQDKSFLALCRKHGLDPQQAASLIGDKFEEGGTEKKPYEPTYTAKEAYGEEGLKRLTDLEASLKAVGYEGSLVKSDKAGGKEIPDIAAMQKFVSTKYPELVKDYMSKVPKTNQGKATPDDPLGGFVDGEWWYRFPKIEKKVFTDKTEYDKYIAENKEIKQGDQSIYTSDSENYVIPEFTTEENAATTAAKKDDAYVPIPNVGGDTPLMMPSQEIMPPSAMEAQMMGKVRVGTVDAAAKSEEPFLQRQSDALSFMKKFLGGSPSAQSSSVMSNVLGTSEGQLFEQLSKNQEYNILQKQQADNINTQAGEREQTMDLQNMLSFEQRQQTAKGKTEADLNNYFESLRQINLGKFNTQHQASLLNKAFPNIMTDAWGRPIFDPKTGLPLVYTQPPSTDGKKKEEATKTKTS